MCVSFSVSTEERDADLPVSAKFHIVKDVEKFVQELSPMEVLISADFRRVSKVPLVCHFQKEKSLIAYQSFLKYTGRLETHKALMNLNGAQ